MEPHVAASVQSVPQFTLYELQPVRLRGLVFHTHPAMLPPAGRLWGKVIGLHVVAPLVSLQRSDRVRVRKEGEAKPGSTAQRVVACLDGQRSGDAMGLLALRLLVLGGEAGQTAMVVLELRDAHLRSMSCHLLS